MFIPQFNEGAAAGIFPMESALGSKPIPVLIVDDDTKFARLLRDYLLPFGFELHHAGNGPEGLRQMSDSRYQAAILDVMLPGMDGMELLRRLGPGRRVPVLMLTARGEEPDRIRGLETGADDYVSKAVSPREILARLRALTRRQQINSQVENEATIRVGDLEIQCSTREASMNGTALSLTSLEYDLLVALARHAGKIRSRHQLLRDAASRQLSEFDRTIDVHISSLRRKLGDDPRNPAFIVTVRNAGYMMREVK